MAEVRPNPYRVVVNLGTEEAPVLTGPLEVLVPRSGASMVDFSPLDPGEGVLTLAPGGSDSVMYVLPSLVRGRGRLVAGPGGPRATSTAPSSRPGRGKAGAQIALGPRRAGGWGVAEDAPASVGGGADGPADAGDVKLSARKER